uniref:Uncharacterized protein n=1 Tax=Lepeophtheirus salmonis TaxID=72036 RepID=A0A0K2UZH3_LEPSM
MEKFLKTLNNIEIIRFQTFSKGFNRMAI